RCLDGARAPRPPAATSSAAPEFGFTRFVGWNEQGTAGLVSATSADFKQEWLWSMDAATGAMTLLANDRDEAWVAGPCSFCIGWLPDGRAYFVSERDGFAHLYSIAADGSGLRQLTSGNWEVHSVELSADRERFYLTANEEPPPEQHFYHMRFDGSNRTRITTMPGRQDATPSPDGSRIAFVHSTSNTPPELYVAQNRAGADA